MSTPTLVILLIIFLGAFLGLEPFLTNVVQKDVTVMGISLLGTGFQAFLGLGVVFIQFLIFFFAFLDRIGDTIKAVLKPLISLLPLLAFIGSVQRTFMPFFLTILPDSLALQLGEANVTASAGIPQNENYIATAIANGSFTTNVLLTVGTMVLFALTSYATTRSADVSQEVRRLREENAKIKRLLQ